MNYSEKLKDPRWQKKRLKILERDDFMCKFCGDTKSTLNVHHISYFKNPWDVEDKFLITLCESCHKEEEIELVNSSKKLIQDLRKCGFTSSSINSLAKIFKDEDRGWSLYEPAFDILKSVVDNDKLWQEASDLFWEKLRKKNR